ncbi:MAG: NAD(P)/FAD-dependent oxidoreductase [Gammaproteobacteria bacterium]
MMAPKPDTINSDDRLPRRTSVAIIGGGIVGACTALELAERGVDVTLLEKGVIAGEQSSRNWGWCRQMGRDPREIPLAIEALKQWRGMNERVGAETGFNQCGIAYLCEDEKELAAQAHWLEEHARPYQLDSKLLDAEQVSRRLPGGAKPWKGALFTASDGRAEPHKAAPAIARAAQARGAMVFTQCAVRGLETAAGRVSGVVTERGTVECDSIVLAGGAWSRHLCRSIGIDLPQLTVINSVMRTGPIDAGLEHSGAGNHFGFRKRLDGGYTIAHNRYSVADVLPASFKYFQQFLPALRADWNGLKLRFGKRFFDELAIPRTWPLDRPSPFEKVRILDPPPVKSILDEAGSSLRRFYPAFNDMQVEESWAGCIDVTPDVVPVISEVRSLPGFYLSTGFSGHGFGIGPGAGKLTADLVTGRAPIVDPEPFRYERMIDGTKLAPM